jgi:hypothetical protein
MLKLGLEAWLKKVLEVFSVNIWKKTALPGGYSGQFTSRL